MPGKNINIAIVGLGRVKKVHKSNMCRTLSNMCRHNGLIV